MGIAAAMAGTLIGTTACGVILYPERKGQVDGRIDPAVAEEGPMRTDDIDAGQVAVGRQDRLFLVDCFAK